MLWRLRDWPLLPTKDKVPHDPLTLTRKADWARHRRALSDEEWAQLEMLLQTGEWGVGVVCGHNVVVLDIDQEELPTLPGLEVNAWTHRTPRGGWHFVYSMPAHPVGTHRRGPIEVRAEGAFAVIPPSPGYTGVAGEWPPEGAPPKWPFYRLFELPGEAMTLWSLRPLPGMKDHSLSGFDYRLAHVALSAGWSSAEAVQLLKAFRAVHGAEESDRYYLHTVQNVLQEARKVRRGVIFQDLAAEFLEKSNRRWLYSASRSMFYVYAEGYWKPVTPEEVRHILRQTLPHHTELQRTAVAREVVDNLITLLLEAVPNADERLEEALYNPRGIVFRDRTLDLAAWELRPHDPNDYAQYRIPHTAVMAEPESRVWRQLLEEWVPKETAAYLQQWAGYLMTPDTSLQAMLVLYGVGANGKSLFLYGLETLLGTENLAHVPLDRFAERFELAFLQYKLANIFADLDTRYIERTGTIKAFVGGDRIRAEYKGGAVFYYRPITRLVFSTNELPHASDISPGWYDRFRIVPFRRRFDRNPNAQHQIRQAIQAAAPEIVWWAIQGLHQILTYGWKEDVEDLRQARAAFVTETNSVVAFLSEMEDPNGVPTTVSTQGLYTAYTVWAANTGLRPVAKRRFVAALKEAGYEVLSGVWCRDLGRSSYGVQIALEPETAAHYGLPVAASRRDPV